MRKNILTINTGLLLWAVSLLFNSCYSDTQYYTYQKLPSNNWNRTDTLSFLLEKPLPTGKYQIEIGIRHSVQYAYCDLWLGVLTESDSLSMPTDTLHIEMASKQGQWKGDSSGGLFQLVYPKNISINVEGKDSLRSVRIFHLMKDNPLKGVSNVGIRIFQKD